MARGPRACTRAAHGTRLRVARRSSALQESRQRRRASKTRIAILEAIPAIAVRTAREYKVLRRRTPTAHRPRARRSPAANGCRAFAPRRRPRRRRRAAIHESLAVASNETEAHPPRAGTVHRPVCREARVDTRRPRQNGTRSAPAHTLDRRRPRVRVRVGRCARGAASRGIARAISNPAAPHGARPPFDSRARPTVSPRSRDPARPLADVGPRESHAGAVARRTPRRARIGGCPRSRAGHYLSRSKGGGASADCRRASRRSRACHRRAVLAGAGARVRARACVIVARILVDPASNHMLV